MIGIAQFGIALAALGIVEGEILRIERPGADHRLLAQERPVPAIVGLIGLQTGLQLAPALVAGAVGCRGLESHLIASRTCEKISPSAGGLANG